eukprot:Tamp_10860.p1 GENE.Tamp_10860~~Tamp_10860.p1  ORF type:complete len:501 (-),score=73.70 Tamp_10860:485-1846(-)
MRKDAEFDVIVFGATGFTGNLTARYLGRRLPGNFTFAIAGRSQRKLDALAASLDRRPATILADAGDLTALRALARRSRVVITTAGPFAKHGALLVQACAEEGTHYADLSGEFFFQRDMITAHHDTARHTGAKLVLAAGYDSLPFDVAAVLAYQALAKSDAGGTDEVSIMAAVTQMRGWASGGTVVSAAGMFSQVLSGEQSLSAFLDPYLLVPDAHPNCQVDSEASGWGFLPRFDSRLQQVGLPHFMAYVNARIVRRTLALMGVGALVSYGEGMTVAAMLDVSAFIAPFVWSGLLPLWPAPGQGPPDGVQKQGGFRAVVLASRVGDSRSATHGADAAGRPDAAHAAHARLGAAAGRDGGGSVARVDIHGRGDMGYALTSKLLAEVGLCLAEEACQHQGMGGGVLTPATATSVAELVRRLRQATHEDGRPVLTFDVSVSPSSGRGHHGHHGHAEL